jgi:osmoprotectant transport system ATP-binding protein
MTRAQDRSQTLAPGAEDAASEVMIRLEALTKRYPGQSQPAVDDVSMDIPEGEIVVFVGPSGCALSDAAEYIE